VIDVSRKIVLLIEILYTGGNDEKDPKTGFVVDAFRVGHCGACFRPNPTFEIDRNSVFPPGVWSFSARPFIARGTKLAP